MWGFAEFDRKYVRLIWLPVAAFAVSELLIGLLAQEPSLSTMVCPEPCTPGLAREFAVAQPFSAADRTGFWKESAARMRLLVMALLFFSASCALIWKVSRDLFASFRGMSRTRLILMFLLCFLSVVVLLSASWAGPLPRSIDILDFALFKQAVQVGTGLDRNLSWNLPWSLAVVEGVIDATNVVALVAVSALITAGISCLARFEKLRPEENWKYHSDRLKTYVYLGAFLLVLGVLYMEACASYPAFMLDEASKKDYMDLVHAVTAYSGVEYSLVLSAFALPASLILSRRADTIAAALAAARRDGADGDGAGLAYSEISGVREERGLTISTKDTLRTLAALVAPLLTGSVASFVSVLS